MGSYGLLLQSMGFLILIIILAYFALRYGLRSLYRGMNGGYMKVLERVPIDPKSGSALILVQVGREVYLVGTAQGGVSLLKTFNWKDMQYAEDEEGEKIDGIKGSFNKILDGLKKNRFSNKDQEHGEN